MGRARMRTLLGVYLTAVALGFAPLAGAAQAASDREVLDLRETAEMLRVAPGVVRELAESHRIPGRRIGNDWRFSRSALLDWLKGEQSANEASAPPRPVPVGDQHQPETLAREFWNITRAGCQPGTARARERSASSRNARA